MELNPQQIEFLASYTNPSSKTFGNALQSALKAGYSQEYAESITCQMPEWLSENLGKAKRLKKAEKNLEQVQELPVLDENGKVLVDVLRERNKVDLFIAETIGKKDYSKRNELTGANGKDLPVPILNGISSNNSDKEDTGA
jgi:hypothetical protein